MDENQTLAPAPTEPAKPSGSMADTYLRDSIIQEATAQPDAPTATPAPQSQELPAWAQMPSQPQQPQWQPQWQQPAPQPVPQQPASTVPYGLTPEQHTAYEDAIPVIEQIINARLQPVAQNLQDVARMNDQNFIGTVRQSVPVFDAVVNDPRWNNFLNSQVPGMAFTQRQALEAAHVNRSVGAIQNLFNTFAAATGLANQPKATPVPYGASNVTLPAGMPATSVVPNASMQTSSPAPAQEAKLKWSTYDKASTAYIKGHLPREEFMKIKAIYDPAIEQGRISYDH